MKKVVEKQFTNTRGITLIALVVTIIILLILAGIIISNLTNSSLLKNLILAKEEAKNAQEKEGIQLQEYENKMGEYISGIRNNGSSKILYASNTGVNSIQLNENINNYDLIEITAKDKFKGCSTIKVKPDDLTSGIFIGTHAIDFAASCNNTFYVFDVKTSNGVDILLSNFYVFYGWNQVATASVSSSDVWINMIIGIKL